MLFCRYTAQWFMTKIVQTNDPVLLAQLNEEVQQLHQNMHPQLFKPYNKEAIATALKDFLARENCLAYLALADYEPAGYMILFINDSPENAFKYSERILYIDQIGVMPKYRGLGLSKALLQKAEALAKELSIKTLELDHWSANEVAAGIFRKCGFELCRERLRKYL